MDVETVIAGIRRSYEERVRATAEQFLGETRDVLGVSAPIALARPTWRNRRAVRAATPASPGAPPRRVTGTLQRAQRLRRVSALEWQVGNFGGAPYATRLEMELDHRFLGVVRDRFRFDEGRHGRFGFGLMEG